MHEGPRVCITVVGRSGQDVLWDTFEEAAHSTITLILAEGQIWSRSTTVCKLTLNPLYSKNGYFYIHIVYTIKQITTINIINKYNIT